MTDNRPLLHDFDADERTTAGDWAAWHTFETCVILAGIFERARNDREAALLIRAFPEEAA
ncbi:MAG: hypothetical protein V1755_02680 [Chloroflexota bacterium]